MARYLKSLATGVVLPYVEASLKSADVRLMDPEECAEYEAGLNRPVASEVVEPEVVAEPEVGEVLVEDLDPVEEVLGALEVD